MIAIKGMELQTDCKKCPFMATDGVDLLSSMMCLALWATKHEVKHCVEGKILNDCPLVEIVTCKDCKYYRNEDDDEWCTNHSIHDNKFWVREDYFCADAERRE